MSHNENMRAVLFQIDHTDTLQQIVDALPTIPFELVAECYDEIKITRWENARERNA